MVQTASPEYVAILARFAASLDFAAVPGRVREQAKLVILDTLGAGLAAVPTPAITALADLGRARRGPASLLGRRTRTAPEVAALVNGAAMTMLELDEGHHGTLGHVAIHVIPAALALAEELDASGADLLGAVLAGYEVGARVARLGEVRAEMHPHATWGTMAGATACARLAASPAEEIARALGIGASFALVTSRGTIAAGATVKYALTGVAGELALQAFRLARTGFTAEPDGPRSLFAVISVSPQPVEVTLAGLGEQWEIERNYYKVHSCCRYAAPAVDATLEIRRRRPFEAEEVGAIRVETFAKASRLHAVATHHELAARFSVPYCVAAAAVLGHCDLDAFGSPVLADGRIAAVAGRVEVVEDAAHTAAFPAATPARVTITFGDGTVERGEVRHAVGDPERPLAAEMLRGKFLRLAARALAPAAAEAALEAVLRLDDLVRVRELGTLLRGQTARRRGVRMGAA